MFPLYRFASTWPPLKQRRECATQPPLRRQKPLYCLLLAAAPPPLPLRSAISPSFCPSHASFIFPLLSAYFFLSPSPRRPPLCLSLPVAVRGGTMTICSRPADPSPLPSPNTPPQQHLERHNDIAHTYAHTYAHVRALHAHAVPVM